MKKQIKILIKKIMLKLFTKKIYLYISIIKNYKKIGKKTSFGDENKDKIFYVIGRGEGGLLWILLQNLGHIAYAVERGYIPVIDLQNNDNQYLERDALYKENAWEYYFKQPMGYNLQDISKSKNIIYNWDDAFPINYGIDVNINEDKENLYYFRKIYRKYIKFSDFAQEYLYNDFHSIMNDCKYKTLGVLCRGTDYLYKRPLGHYIQPEPEEVIKKAEEVMKCYKCEYLYLATEDHDIFTLFKQYFGNKLLTNNQLRFSKKDIENIQYLSQINHNRKRDKYFMGLEYLSSIFLLSKCSCFIGGLTAGTTGVYLMSDGFEYDFFYELGRYA